MYDLRNFVILCLFVLSLALGSTTVFYKITLDTTAKALEIEKDRPPCPPCPPCTPCTAQQIPTVKIVFIPRRENDTLADVNKNPLNVKQVPGGWEGSIGSDKFGHAVFKYQRHGIRAGLMVLRSYMVKHRLNTAQLIVDRFCKSNKIAYVNHLHREVGKGKLALSDIPRLAVAMAKFESGTKLDIKTVEKIYHELPNHRL